MLRSSGKANQVYSRAVVMFDSRRQVKPRLLRNLDVNGYCQSMSQVIDVEHESQGAFFPIPVECG